MNVAPPGYGRSAAFTLLEILLAVAIFAVVLVAVHSIFYGALRLRNQTTAAVEAGVPLQQALAIIKHDLENLVVPGTALAGALQSTPTNDNSGALRGRVSSPHFYTSGGVLGDAAPWGDIQKVSYFLAPATNQAAGQDLYRSVTRNLLPLMQEEPEDQWLMGGIERLVFWFHDGTAWRTTWDSPTEATPLPRAVKLELLLAPEENQQELPSPIELIVPLVVQARTNQTTQSSSTGGSL